GRRANTQHACPYALTGERALIGTTGSAMSLWQLAQAQWGASELDRDSLARIHASLLDAGHVDTVQLAGLRPERRPVLAGGLAVVMAALDERGVGSARHRGGAVRAGGPCALAGR